MKYFEYTFTSSTGVDQIPVKGWLPEGEIKAVIQYHHGVTSYMGKSADFTQWLCQRGYAVVGHDCLGHGKTAYDNDHLGWFAEQDGWTHVVNDFAHLYRQLRERFPNKKLFVYGNSMGSFVVRSFLIRFPEEKPDGVILAAGSMNSKKILDESYALVEKLVREGKDPKKGSKEIQRHAFGTYSARLPEGAGPFDWVCSDVKTFTSKPSDKYSMFFFSPSLYKDMTDGQVMNSDPRQIEKMRKDVPVYIVSGAEDPAGAYGEGPRQVEQAFKAAGVGDVTLRLYEGERHDLFQGFKGQQFMEELVQWIEEKAAE